MGIVTKRGDRGRTSLYRGVKVAKDDIRVEICGCLDEVSSFLGMAKSLLRDRKFKDIIESAQKDLFPIGAEVATRLQFIKKIKKRVCDKDVRRLEETIGVLEDSGRLKFKNFKLPGANEISSALDIARAITRRTERRVVTILKKKMIANRYILIYLNRLSDLLYLLARMHDKRGGAG